MSTGIFLAGRGGMIPQGSLAQELLPKQELDGDKPSAESKGIWFFFPWQENSWVFITVGAKFQRSLGLGMVSLTPTELLWDNLMENPFLFS